MEGLSQFFSEVDDPRSEKNVRHDFIMLIGTSILAVLCGIDSFSGISEFVESHEESLSEHFIFTGGVPSHDTYQRVWDTINPAQFECAFLSLTKVISSRLSELICLDGKTIRNSGTTKPLHLVSAWCEANQLVLAQKKVSEKSNEITAVPELLKMLDIKNCVVTMDAMGAQRKTCEQIIEQGGDYLISLKGNQGNLHKDVMEYFSDESRREQCDYFTEYDKGHGRLEERTAYVLGGIEWLQEKHKWPGLTSVAAVKSKVTRKGKTCEETRFYISSSPANAKKTCANARAHWGIENKLHWRLDVTFNEDKACIRNDNAAENMNLMRKFALAILHKAKDKPEQSIKSVMRKNAMSFKHLIKTVNKISHA